MEKTMRAIKSVIFVIVFLLFLIALAAAQDLQLPPDLTMITKHGISYSMLCSTISVESHDGKFPPHDEHICNVIAKVEFDDDRKPWTQPIAETRDLDPDKALHEANLAGEKWMAKCRKAILEDMKKRGHEVKR